MGLRNNLLSREVSVADLNHSQPPGFIAWTIERARSHWDLFRIRQSSPFTRYSPPYSLTFRFTLRPPKPKLRPKRPSETD